MGKLNREKIKKAKEVIKLDGRLLESCTELRHTVEHPNESADIIIAKGTLPQERPGSDYDD